MEEIWTVGRMRIWAADYLAGYGVESPRLSAELLLAKALGCRRVDIYLRFDQPLAKAEMAAFKELLIRRREHEPVAYILGNREFYGLDLKVGPGVLVPRPETEMLVEEGLRRLAEVEKSPRMLDLCTGSGAVALAVCNEDPRVEAVGVDASARALEYARENSNSLGLADRVAWLLGDLYGPLAAGGGFFDLITANPPYITQEEWPELPREVRDHEPREALAGGRDGLDIARGIVGGANAFLRPLGWLMVELGAGQGPGALALAKKAGVFQEMEILQDLAGKDRVLVCQRKDYG